MPGWNITLAYYIACLHLRAWACTQNVHYTQHHKYEGWLSGRPEAAAWWKEYRSLENRSRAARYDGTPMGKPELQQTVNEFNFVMGHLAQLLQKQGLKVHKIDIGPFLL